jgi:hypothetical protein
VRHSAVITATDGRLLVDHCPPDRGFPVQRPWFHRTVGLIVLALAGGAGGLLWYAVSASDPASTPAPTEGLLFGIWRVFYNTQAPHPLNVAAAAAVAMLCAAVVALLERRIANRYRRSADQHSTPLAPKVVMAATRGVFAGPVTVTVLVPAHNEERTVGGTLASLLAQSHRPERVVVVADNCTDATAEIAHRAGAEVFETTGYRQ